MPVAEPAPSAPTDPTRPPVVLVLASGRGERFKASGGQVHKLQAELGGRRVLEHTLAAVSASGLPWHLEDRGHPGMGDSIAAAVRATAQAPGWLILPGDLPLVRSDTLCRVAEALARWAVVQPMHGSTAGHPVGFAACCREGLLALSGEAGAAAVLRHWQARGQLQRLALDDPGTVTDIDTLADLERAAAWLARRGSSSGA